MLKLGKMLSTPPAPHYAVEVKFMHGDADKYEETVYKFPLEAKSRLTADGFCKTLRGIMRLRGREAREWHAIRAVPGYYDYFTSYGLRDESEEDEPFRADWEEEYYPRDIIYRSDYNPADLQSFRVYLYAMGAKWEVKYTDDEEA